MANAFGSGKRSYVMCPYTRVVDNDSNYETSRVEDVLNGDLEDFIIAGLRKWYYDIKKNKRKKN